MTAKDMLLSDALTTAIKGEKKRLRIKKILMISLGLNIILMILAIKRR